MQTLPEGGTGKVENIESLQWLERERRSETHLECYKPNQIVALIDLQPLLIPPPIEYAVDLVVKLGRRPFEATELFQGVAGHGE